ncbi:putative acetyltransferase [Actinacidiphila reveromycinica]|uniref:Putative acetyltransferase n=1 Tax=Actinacidiphila reveromycinica TaxID=659352 RepID=A0A7U3UX86_9ACTN|nr:GNAT family N-acetyltransferase [Streptomyces sp. SN-593]BBB00307.1 putative acetyltransferase [Streptomyces sp. SN-593]
MRNDLIVTQATAAEWDEIVAWTADEGWNPGHGDAAHFLPSDPAGFLVGRLGGRVVSAVSVVVYSPAYAFLGYYLVHPEHRGTGLGLTTWNAALPRARGRVIGLDGVPAQQAAYARAGFLPAYRNVRHTGRPRTAGAAADPAAALAVAPHHHRAIAAYDRGCFPAARPEFVARWLTGDGHTARVLLGADGGVRGYGVIRPAHQGHRIGPLFADSPEEAGVLFDALVATLPPGAEVAIDIPDLYPAAAKLAADRGLSATSECLRMYTGQAPASRVDAVYGTTTLELG